MYPYLKYGKTLGLETVRYVKYHEGKLYYYEVHFILCRMRMITNAKVIALWKTSTFTILIWGRRGCFISPMEMITQPCILQTILFSRTSSTILLKKSYK